MDFSATLLLRMRSFCFATPFVLALCSALSGARAQFDDEFDDPDEGSYSRPARDATDEFTDDEFTDDEFTDDEFTDDEFTDDEFTDDEFIAPAQSDVPDGEHQPAELSAEPSPEDDRFFEEDQLGGDQEDGNQAATDEVERSDLASQESTNGTERSELSSARQRELFRAHGSWWGPVGGFRVVDAGSGEPGSFRLQLATQFFGKRDFLASGDQHGHIAGAASLSYTVHRNVETWITVAGFANSNDVGDPDLIMALGDTSLGVKAFFQPADLWTVGGDLSFRFLSPVSGVGTAFDTVNIGIRANLSADLRKAKSTIPLIARFNLQYLFDQSENLVDSTERNRYAALADPLPTAAETRNLITALERFGNEVNRTDFVNLGLGFEAPLRVATDFYVHPILEWTLGVPVNRQDYTCAIIDGDADRCLEQVGFSAFPQDLTVGVRVLPPIEGLATFFGLDIGLTGTRQDQFVRELSPNSPYMILLGASYAYKVRPAPAAPVEYVDVTREVEVPAEAPPRGRIRGIAVVGASGAPVAGTRIRFPGRDRTPLSVDDAGRFVTYLFEPGEEISMFADHPNYHGATCTAMMPEDGSDTEVRCELEEQLVVVEDTEVQLFQQIKFAFDSDEILSDSFGLMRQIADVLQQNPELSEVEIQGHTDNVGNRRYNLELSERRAQSVRDWLVNAGIEQQRLTANGYGMERPIAAGSSPEARAQNRRVQFLILVQNN
ncbi:MAG: OmpA family protein [Myxococcota bacterium]